MFPDNGACYFLPRLQGKLGFYMGMTGCKIRGIQPAHDCNGLMVCIKSDHSFLGADVLHAGIATHYCDSSKIPELERTLLSLKNSDHVENVLDEFCPKPQIEFSLSKHMDQINECFDANSIEEILEKLKNDGSDWAKQTTKVIFTTNKTKTNPFHFIAMEHFINDRFFGEHLHML